MKAMIVVDIPNIIEPCAIDELGFVADLHISPTTLCDYDPFDLKDVDVRPLPEQMTWGHTADYIEGYNACLDEIMGEDNG